MDRHIPLPYTYNIRDLGGYPGARGTTAWRRIFRADSPHRLDAGGHAALHGLGVRTMIDLRHAQELSDASYATVPADGIRYVSLPMFEGLDPHHPKLIEADDPLLALYRDVLETRADAMRAIFAAIAEASEGAVLFHCSAGKDRTGITAAMLLLLAGVPEATVVEDFTLTARYLAPMIEKLRAEAAAQGRDLAGYEPYLRAEAATMAGFLETLATQYGGAETYLCSVGVTEPQIAALRSRLGENK